MRALQPSVAPPSDRVIGWPTLPSLDPAPLGGVQRVGTRREVSQMLRTRMAKASLVAGALILAMMGPAMAAGGPGDTPGKGGPSMGAGAPAAAAPTAARPDSPGNGGGPMDNPGSGNGRPESPGGGGGKPDNPGGGGGKPGGETAGNNLSFPVQWSEDGMTVALPGDPAVVTVNGVVLPGTYSTDDMTPCLGAVQKDANNSWQADSALAASNVITTIDWGDNLESKDWKLGTVVRVETGLYDNVLPDTMTRYEMCYISGSGTDEVWGLRVTGSAGAYVPVQVENTEAMVYTAGARLTIQQIVPGGTYTWDPATHMWTGTGASAPIFNAAAWQKTTDGPGSYGAELNVGGKIVYGFVWKTTGLTAGEYRLTFSLDDAEAGFVGSGASFDATTTILGAVTEVAAAEEGGGNTAVVDTANQLTYIDVGLTSGGGSSR